MKEYLFHYTKAKNYREIINNQTLLLNNINKTNDPYENKKFDFFDINEIKKEGEKKIEDEDDNTRWFFRQLNRMKNRIVKTLSFSQGDFRKTLNQDNRPGYFLPRMWAQYAEYSTGVCFVFNKEKLLKELKSKLEPDYYFFSDSIEYRNILDKDYSTKIKNLIKQRRTEVFGQGNDKNRQDLMVNNIREHIHDYYFTKDEDWAGEREYRVIIINKRERQELNHKMTEPLKLPITIQDVLECVIIGENFGLKEKDDEFLIDEKEIDMIKSLCREKNITLKAITRDIYRSNYSLTDLFTKIVEK